MDIDWGNKIINVYQADLTLVSGALYTLDTDWFRLTLKSLEDDEAGMSYPDTHRHNTEVTVAGVTYSRTIEIINGYQVEFEDGQYTVRLEGSNNNIFDVENGILVRNQVSLIPTNSAGLNTVTSGSGLSATQDQRLRDIWRDNGLDIANPTSISEAAGTTTKTSGDVELDITDTSVTRQ